MKKILLAAVFLFASINAYSIPVFIGSYHVTDGDIWTSNPDVFSAIEAAEFVFGPVINGNYSISINGTDINNISHTGWYAEIGVGPSIFDENFSQDLGPTVGYNGGGWSSGDDISAYVNDAFFSNDQGTNYVFFESAQIPEPAPLALISLGLAGIAFSRKKKASK